MPMPNIANYNAEIFYVHKIDTRLVEHLVSLIVLYMVTLDMKVEKFLSLFKIFGAAYSWH